jgi:hypothetical protein
VKKVTAVINSSHTPYGGLGVLPQQNPAPARPAVITRFTTGNGTAECGLESITNYIPGIEHGEISSGSWTIWCSGCTFSREIHICYLCCIFQSRKSYDLSIIPASFPTQQLAPILASCMHIWEAGFSSLFEIIFYIRCFLDLTKNNTVEENHHL